MSWSAQRLYTPPEGLAYASGIETPALRLFLQHTLGSPHSDGPYPRCDSDAFGVRGLLEQLPFIIRATELMLGCQPSCGTARPAFFGSLSLHARIVTG